MRKKPAESPGRHPVTQEALQTIATLYLEGRTYEDIARKLVLRGFPKYHIETVGRAVRELGLRQKRDQRLRELLDDTLIRWELQVLRMCEYLEVLWARMFPQGTEGDLPDNFVDLARLFDSGMRRLYDMSGVRVASYPGGSSADDIEQDGQKRAALLESRRVAIERLRQTNPRAAAMLEARLGEGPVIEVVAKETGTEGV